MVWVSFDSSYGLTLSKKGSTHSSQRSTHTQHIYIHTTHIHTYVIRNPYIRKFTYTTICTYKYIYTQHTHHTHTQTHIHTNMYTLTHLHTYTHSPFTPRVSRRRGLWSTSLSSATFPRESSHPSLSGRVVTKRGRTFGCRVSCLDRFNGD